MNPVDVGALRLEREFAAPPEAVFDAWTNPEVLRRWWAAQPSGTSPGCEVDLRVGGRYRMRMQDEEGGEVHAVSGEFHEVERPTRLVYSWCWDGTHGPHPGHVSVVTVEFHPTPGGTLVSLDHSGLATEESAVRHAQGWNGALDNLAGRIFDNPDQGRQ
jgi:uncharacterized protein YndB with AHSA1/START domain